MNAVADICIIPIHGKLSVRKEVARAHQMLQDAGLKTELHAYGTNVEGELSVILRCIEEIHATLHQDGVPRVHSAIKIGTRNDKAQGMQDKVEVVKEILRGGGTGND